MKVTDISALMKGIAPVLCKHIQDELAPLQAKIGDLERDLAATKVTMMKAAKR